jgi:hypothetical protein
MADVNQANARLDEYTPLDDEDKTRPILRSLLTHAPTPAGRASIALEVTNCNLDEELRKLSKYFLANLLIPSEPSDISFIYPFVAHSCASESLWKKNPCHKF